jgi:choline dehydrogenase-like flavoprotein
VDESITDMTAYPFVGEHHGTDGPCKTSFNPTSLPIEDAVIKAADDACGFSTKPKDPWSGDHIGFYQTLGSVVRTGPDKGKRSYPTRGYFEPNAHRPNLKVICESLVHKVLLEGNKATGAEFSYGGKTYQVKANKEVIVSAGAVKSPQILELSGIGDPEVLKAAGVEVKIENKGIGANLQDHATSGTNHWLVPGELSASILAHPDALHAAQVELMTKQSGPLTCISGVQGFFPYKKFATPEQLKATVDSIKATKTTSDFHKRQLDQIVKHLESDTSANLQLVLLGGVGDFKKGCPNQAELFDLALGPDGACGISFALCLQYPVARGTVHITSDGEKNIRSVLMPRANNFIRSNQRSCNRPRIYVPFRR